MDQPPAGDPPQPGTPPAPGGWAQPAPPAGPTWGQPAQATPPPPAQPGPAWGQPPPAPPAPAAWAQPAPAGSQWVMPAATKGPVTVLAKFAGVLVALVAALWIFFGVVIIIGGAVTKGLFDSIGSGSDVSNAVGGAIAVFGIIIVFFGAIEFIGGLGALFGRDWGRVISIIYSLLFGAATLFIGISALAGGRNVDTDVANGAIGGGLFFLAHAVVYLFAAIVLMARWRGPARAA